MVGGGHAQSRNVGVRACATISTPWLRPSSAARPPPPISVPSFPSAQHSIQLSLPTLRLKIFGAWAETRRARPPPPPPPHPPADLCGPPDPAGEFAGEGCRDRGGSLVGAADSSATQSATLGVGVRRACSREPAPVRGAVAVSGTRGCLQLCDNLGEEEEEAVHEASRRCVDVTRIAVSKHVLAACTCTCI